MASIIIYIFPFSSVAYSASVTFVLFNGFYYASVNIIPQSKKNLEV